MKTAKVFQNGQSQAIRLPKEFRFQGNVVFVKRMGNGILLIPTKNPWEPLLNSLDEFSEDFMTDRMQPPPQSRESF